MPNRLLRMSGRDLAETHRSATPLELLFDLAFVVAFAQAADVAYVVEGDSQIGVTGAILSVAVPVLLFSLMCLTLYAFLVQRWDPLHVALFGGTLSLLVLAVVLAVVGAPIGLCLMVVTLSPAVVVVGYEVVGNRHQTEVLEWVLR